MNAVRKEVKQRRARLINQQDHIAFLKCKGCPKRTAYDPTKKCRGCKVYRELRSIGKELEQISNLRRWKKRIFERYCAARRETKMKTIAWFSGGVSSFISIYLMKDQIDEIYFIDVEEQHEDTYRFLKDCEKAIGRKFTIIKNEKTHSAVEIIRQRRYINGPSGAPCTSELKRKVRQRWEQTQDEVLRYVWGYDSEEKHRAERLLQTTPEHEHVFPLIDAMLTKDEVHGLLERLGIKRPLMYELGFRNNNCVGCVKGGMGYWNMIRKHFPERFYEMAALEREIGATCIKGVYLDELDPERGRIEDEVMGECGILCEIAYANVI